MVDNLRHQNGSPSCQIRLTSSSGITEIVDVWKSPCIMVLSTLEVFSMWRGYCEYIGGYLEYIGGCSVHRGILWFIWGSKLIKAFDLYWKPRCTEHPPMYSWYPPMYSWYPSDVLMVSLWCTHDNPWCIQDNSLMYSWYPLCTEYPPPPPDALNTHYTG